VCVCVLIVVPDLYATIIREVGNEGAKSDQNPSPTCSRPLHTALEWLPSQEEEEEGDAQVKKLHQVSTTLNALQKRRHCGFHRSFLTR
jgi:hypothetical protein